MFGCNHVVRVWESVGLWDIISDHILQVENVNQLVFSLLESFAPNKQH